MLRRAVLVAGRLVGACRAARNPPPTPADAARPAKKKEYRLALIAKNQANPVFQAARVGAEDAARDLSRKLGVPIKVALADAERRGCPETGRVLEQLVAQGVDGIGISCSVADTATPAIDAAVKQGVAVMCFDSDAPQSKRFCFYGTDDFGAGRTIMSELAKVLGPGKHVVAIPGGNQNAANIQNRIRGALEEAKKYPEHHDQGPFTTARRRRRMPPPRSRKCRRPIRTSTAGR